MPNKAAQILGTASRQARIIPVRPIKPARPVESTPTRTSRSDTVKSLPAKVVDPDSYAHRHHSGSSRRQSTSGRGSPGRGGLKKQSYNTENTRPVPDVNESSDSVVPPSPPAKDTPPPAERQPSPLRRAAPTRGDLRDSYSDFNDNISRIQFPKFDLSPVRSSYIPSGHGGSSPTKSRPYTAEDYTELIEDGSMQWPYPNRNDSPIKAEGKHHAPLAGVGLGSLQLPRPDRLSKERPDTMSETSADEGPGLLPHFYSPSRITPFPFAEGETPSKNVSLLLPPRLLLSPSRKVGPVVICPFGVYLPRYLHMQYPASSSNLLVMNANSSLSLTKSAFSTHIPQGHGRSSTLAKSRPTAQSR